MPLIYLGMHESALRDRIARLLQGFSDTRIEALSEGTNPEQFPTDPLPDVVVTDHTWVDPETRENWLSRLKGGRKIAYWVVIGPDDVKESVKWFRSGADMYLADTWSDEDLREKIAQVWTEPPVPAPVISRKDMVLLQVIREISRNLDDIETLLNLSMDASMEISRADYGSILLYNEAIHALEVKQQRGNSEPVKPTWGFFGFSQGQLQTYLQAHSMQILQKPEHYRQACASPFPEIRTMVVAPILDQEEPVGVMMLAKLMGNSTPFTRLELEVIQAFARDLAPVIRNALVHARTQELNLKDDLTDAYNRRYFEQFLPDEIRRSERFGAKLSIIFLDLDNLKSINEQYGHLMGSKSLQEIAHRMILAVRGSDRVVRYGGDEFCIILPETDSEGARQVAERIRQEIAMRPFLTSEGLGVKITASFGIATYPLHGRTKDELVEAADKAMFEVKMTTKNAIKIAEPLAQRVGASPPSAETAP